jgi:hypothetical protein
MLAKIPPCHLLWHTVLSDEAPKVSRQKEGVVAINLSCLCHHKLLRRLSMYVVTSATIVAMLAAAEIANASVTWQGGDWGGKDFTPGNGDILTGTFVDIGNFIVDAGDTVYAGSSLISLAADDAVINGTLDGGSALSPSLDISSLTNITLGGTLDQWSSVSLSAGSSIITGTISLLSGSSIQTVGSSGSAPSAGTITLSAGGNLYSAGQDVSIGSSPVIIGTNVTLPPGDGTINLDPVPLPSAMCLLAPGLAFAGLVRRWHS